MITMRFYQTVRTHCRLSEFVTIFCRRTDLGLRKVALLISLGLSLGISACSSQSNQYDALAVQSIGNPPSYRLNTGDRISITVFNESNLSGEYDLDSSGVVSLPLTGPIQIAKMTTQEAEDTIEKRLSSGFVSKPNVTVSVVNYRPFYVLGEVARPGGYPFYPGATVITAVAVAGGYTYRAEKFNIRLLRQGTETNATPKKMTPGTFIEPGDIIIIPERWF